MLFMSSVSHIWRYFFLFDINTFVPVTLTKIYYWKEKLTQFCHSIFQYLQNPKGSLPNFASNIKRIQAN